MATVEFVIEGRDQLSGAAKSANSALGGLKQAAQQAGSSFASMSSKAGQAASSFSGLKNSAGQVQSSLAGIVQQAASFAGGMLGVQLVGNAFGMAREALIGFNAQVEQSRIGWGTLMKSQEAGLDMLNKLQTFAATTPFEFPDLERSSKRLMAMGFAAADVIPTMRAVGDTASALGTGPEGIMRMVYALGQMKTKGRVMAEEMMQIGEAGAPVWDMLAQHMGKAVGEVQEMVSRGKVSANDFIAAFKKYAEANYPGMMEKQSRTFEGAMSTIRDNLRILSSRALEPLFNKISALVLKFSELTQGGLGEWADRISRAVTTLIGKFSSFPGPVLRIAAVFAGLSAAAFALGPILGMIGGILGMLSLPILSVVAAATALYIAWQSNWNGIQEITSTVFRVLLQAITLIVQNIARLAVQLGPILMSAASQAQTALAGLGRLVLSLASWIKDNLGLVLQISAITLVTWASIVTTRAVTAAITYAFHLGKLVVGLTTLAAAHIASGVTSTVQFAGAIAKATAQLIIYAAEGLIGAIAATGRFAAILMTQTIPALATLALQLVTKTIPALVMFVAVGIGPALAALPRLVVALGLATAAYAVLGAQATVTAVRMAAAWLMTMLPAVVAGASAILAALAPVAAGIAVIGAAAGLLALAWSQNWGDIQGITTRVLSFVSEQLANFLDFLSGLPIIGEAVKWVKGAVTMAQTELPKLASAAKDAVGNTVGEFAKGFPSIQDAVKSFTGTVSDSSAELPEWAKNMVGSLDEVLNKKMSYDEYMAEEDKRAAEAVAVDAAFAADRAKNDAKNEEARKATAARAAAEAEKEAEKAQSKAEQFAREAESAAKEWASKINAAAPISAVTAALIQFHPAIQAVNLEVQNWQQKIQGVNLAIVANQDQIKAAQAELNRMGESLGGLNAKLSDAKARLSDLAAPKLKGMGEIDKQIALIETQMKRLQLAELKGMSVEDIAKQFPLLDKSAEALAARLPQSREELQKMLEELRLGKDLKFDEQLKKLADAAGDAKKEMTYEEALKQIVSTKGEISSLTSAISSQEAAMAAQKNMVAALQEQGERLNETLKNMQDAQQKTKDKQELMNSALQTAYQWLLEDRDKFTELGEVGVNTASTVDEKARTMLQNISLAAGDVSSISSENLQQMVKDFEKSKSEAVLKIREIAVNLDELKPPIDKATQQAETFRDVWNSLQDKTITLTTLYQYGGGAPPASSIAGMQSGGFASAGTPYFVGESGPELFVPSMSGTVVPNNGLVGSQIIYQQNAPVYGFSNFEDAIVSAVESGKRRGRI